jgi:hypothetical protein
MFVSHVTRNRLDVKVMMSTFDLLKTTRSRHPHSINAPSVSHLMPP